MKRYKLTLERTDKNLDHKQPVCFLFGTTSTEESLVEQIQDVVDAHDDLSWDTHPENPAARKQKRDCDG